MNESEFTDSFYKDKILRANNEQTNTHISSVAVFVIHFSFL